MMGKDCERIIVGINKVQLSLQKLLLTLKVVTKGPIEMEKFSVSYSEGSTEEFELKEKEFELPDGLIDSVKEAKSKLDDDFDKMDTLKKKLYTSTTTFNNGNGSPWTEVQQLKDKLDELIAGMNGLKFKSELIILMPLVSSIISISVDAKISMTMYHDYIQRGYDAEYNGKRPSIVFKKNKDTSGIGNIDQLYDENVNIPPVSLDPY